MNKDVYTEKQNFFTWWLIALVILICIFQVIPFFQGNQQLNTSNYVAIAILFVVIFAFALIRLHTSINNLGITIRFFPFVRCKTWRWEEISDIYIREYTLTDFGGWGYRVGKNGLAYNTKGKYGLQLVLRNGARIMIGTQNPNEVQEIINKFKLERDEIAH